MLCVVRLKLPTWLLPEIKEKDKIGRNFDFWRPDVSGSYEYVRYFRQKRVGEANYSTLQKGATPEEQVENRQSYMNMADIGLRLLTTKQQCSSGLYAS